MPSEAEISIPVDTRSCCCSLEGCCPLEGVEATDEQGSGASPLDQPRTSASPVILYILLPWPCALELAGKHSRKCTDCLIEFQSLEHIPLGNTTSCSSVTRNSRVPTRLPSRPASVEEVTQARLGLEVHAKGALVQQSEILLRTFSHTAVSPGQPLPRRLVQTVAAGTAGSGSCGASSFGS
jgi:hypothetical protein